MTSTKLMQFVGESGSQIRVSRTTGERDVPLLLCNGIGAPVELLAPFRAELATTATVAFDVPGTGHSPPRRWPATLRGVAKTAVGVLDELALPEVDVLGVSWGGILAQELAYRYPGRVRRLVLVSTAAGGCVIPGTPRALLALADTRRYRDEKSLARVARHIYGPEIAADPEFVTRQAQARSSNPPSKRGYLWQQLALRGFGSVLWLRRLRQPTLVVHGAADPVVPAANGRLLAALIPDARLEIIPGGGHMCLLTRPAVVAPIVEDFLAT